MKKTSSVARFRSLAPLSPRASIEYRAYIRRIRRASGVDGDDNMEMRAAFLLSATLAVKAGRFAYNYSGHTVTNENRRTGAGAEKEAEDTFMTRGAENKDIKP